MTFYPFTGTGRAAPLLVGLRRAAWPITLVLSLVLGPTAPALASAAGPCGTGIQGSSQGQTTCTFTYSGSEQVFTVPAGVTWVMVDAIGGAGGQGGHSSWRNAGGVADEVQSEVTGLIPGSRLFVEVGGTGGSNPNVTRSCPVAGGWNGGGVGDCSVPRVEPWGGGGGGASDVRTASRGGSAANNYLNTRVVVASGGGGGGGSRAEIQLGGAGGAGGGHTGQNGDFADADRGGLGGHGATATRGGYGSDFVGGNGGMGVLDSGLLGSGGPGGNPLRQLGGVGGGGGGGGLYGGGGGGGTGPDFLADPAFPGGGGGGGGSDLASTVVGSVASHGIHIRNSSSPARVVITW